MYPSPVILPSGLREYLHAQPEAVVFSCEAELFRFPATDPAGAPQGDQRIDHVVGFGAPCIGNRECLTDRPRVEHGCEQCASLVAAGAEALGVR